MVMGEALRRRHLPSYSPTHNGLAKWRRKERELHAGARLEVLVHDSRKEGTLLRGEAFVAYEEAQAANEKRKPSKVKARLVREWKREHAKRREREQRRTLKAARKLRKAHGKLTASQAQAVAA
jgi:hypothetical protein